MSHTSVAKNSLNSSTPRFSRWLSVVAVLLFLIMSLFTGVVSAKICGDDVDTCNCGDTLVSNYTLPTSLTCSGTGLIIGANNVTLDCNGSTITYGQTTNYSYGVNITGYNSATIKNCNIIQTNSSVSNAHAIYAYYSSNNTFVNNNISTIGSNSHGVYLESSSYNNFTFNNISVSGSGGFPPISGAFLLHSSYNTFTSNNILTSGGGSATFLWQGSNRNIFKNNNITTSGSGAIGARIDDSSYNLFLDNNISTSGSGSYGTYVWYFSTYNNFTSNNIFSADSYGVYVSASYLNSFTSNNISSTSSYALYVDSSYSSSYNNTFTSNKISSIYSYGVALSSTSYNTFTNNTISSTRSVGAQLSSSSYNSFTNNTISSTRSVGAQLSSSSYNSFTNNTISGDLPGVDLFYSSSNNNFTNNTITGGNYGVYIFSSSNYNVFTFNTLSGLGLYGAYLESSSNNTFSNNTISGARHGAYLYYSSNNAFYNNLINGTTPVGFAGTIYSNTWNTTNTAGINIMGGPYLGGNFYATPSGNGFSQTCNDTNYDGFCDEVYPIAQNNIDYLPLSLTKFLSSCGAISSSCVYVLTQDVSSDGTCFTIAANNVTLDCQGHTINYSATTAGYGINITNYNFTTIKNCKIVQGSTVSNAHAIYLSNAKNSTIQNNTISVGSDYSRGTYFYSSSYNHLINNTISAGGYSHSSVYLYYNSNYNTFTNNILSGCCEGGGSSASVYLYYNSNYNTFTNNYIFEGAFGAPGVRLSSSSSNNFTNNNITSIHLAGTYLCSSSDNTFTNNTISSTNYYGAYLYSSSNNTFANNTISSTSTYPDYHGVGLFSSSYNNFTNNTISSTNTDGAYLTSSSNYNTFTNNVVKAGTIDFVSSGSSGNTIINMTFNSTAYPTTASFTYYGNISVDSANAVPSPGFLNVSKYLDITNQSSGAWIYINFSYSNDTIGENETKLRLYRWDGSNWSYVSGSDVDAVNKFVYANITQFSIFAPLADLTPPSVSITSPTSDSHIFDLNLMFIINYTVSDDYLNYTNISIYQGGSLINSTTSASIGSVSVQLGVPAAGYYNITATAYDLTGNSNSSTVTNVEIYSDNTPPLIEILSPSNATWHKLLPLTFTFNATDDQSTTLSCSLYIDDTQYTTNSSVLNSTQTSFTLSSMTNAAHTWKINCSDQAGNSNASHTFDIYFDNQPPDITFSLSSTVVYVGDSITAECNATDNSESYGIPGVTVSKSITGIDTSSVGTKTATCTATDMAGNTVFEERMYTVVSRPSPERPRGCAPLWQCSEWSECSVNGTMTRTCIDLNDCNTTEDKPIEITPCVYLCTPNWQCTQWSECSPDGIQTRTCQDFNNCSLPSPPTSRSCLYIPKDLTSGMGHTELNTVSAIQSNFVTLLHALENEDYHTVETYFSDSVDNLNFLLKTSPSPSNIDVSKVVIDNGMKISDLLIKSNQFSSSSAILSNISRTIPFLARTDASYSNTVTKKLIEKTSSFFTADQSENLISYLNSLISSLRDVYQTQFQLIDELQRSRIDPDSTLKLSELGTSTSTMRSALSDLDNGSSLLLQASLEPDKEKKLQLANQTLFLIQQSMTKFPEMNKVSSYSIEQSSDEITYQNILSSIPEEQQSRLKELKEQPNSETMPVLKSVFSYSIANEEVTDKQTNITVVKLLVISPAQMDNLTVIEFIPKTQNISISDIQSAYNFTILNEDPVIEFNLGPAALGETKILTYTISKKLTSYSSQPFAIGSVQLVGIPKLPTPEEIVFSESTFTIRLIAAILITLFILLEFYLTQKSKAREFKLFSKK